MVAYCCAYNCKEKGTKESPYSFHSFPKDEKRRKEWENAINRENFKATNSTKICSKHFKEDCFDRKKFAGPWLKPDALPTIFDFPDHLMNKTMKRKPQELLSDVNEPTSDESICQENRKKRKYFVGDFEEEDMVTPSIAWQALEMANKQLALKSKTIRNLKKQKSYLTKKVASLQILLQETRNKLFIAESAKSTSEVSIKGTHAESLLSRLKKPKSKEEYPPDLREFALTLHLYSSKAYNYVRENFQTCLPHPKTLSKWQHSSNGSPGVANSAIKLPETLEAKKVEQNSNMCTDTGCNVNQKTH